MPFYYFDYTMLILIPGILIMLFCQLYVNSTFKKYSKVFSQSGRPACEIARDILDRAGLSDIPVEQVSGSLSDHYDPRSRTLRLSESVYHSSSVAAYGVAAHEAGHAIQHQQGYLPIRLRTALVPVVNVAMNLSIPLLLVGFLLEIGGLITAALILYATAFIFSVVTLPVEFNASGRAIAILESGHYLESGEIDGAKAVLRAAASTYLASSLVSLLQLLRLILIARRD